MPVVNPAALISDHCSLAAIACALVERLQPPKRRTELPAPSKLRADPVPGRNLASVRTALHSPAVRAAMPAASTLRPITKVTFGPSAQQWHRVKLLSCKPEPIASSHAVHKAGSLVGRKRLFSILETHAPWSQIC